MPKRTQLTSSSSPNTREHKHELLNNQVQTHREPGLDRGHMLVDADARGYVAYPAIDPVEETADLLGAVRAYELNAAAVQSTKTMIQESVDLLR